MSNEIRRATFASIEQSTADDWAHILQNAAPYSAGVPERVLNHLRLLQGEHHGLPVDRYTHCLQTATRAYRDGRDDEYVLCSLLHDIGDSLAIHNHAEIAAAILKPYVSERRHWMILNHPVFEGFYFYDKVGVDRVLREQFRGHDGFDDAAEFCGEYDQMAFDANYDTLPLEHFMPLVMSLMSAPRVAAEPEAISVG